MKTLFKYILVPFAWLYGAIIFIRNLLFDWNILKSKSFEIPVIGIGNLSAGGTGKTPMAEYVLQLLLEHGYRPAMLSRGYGRQSTGFVEVRPGLNAEITGDEPYQVKRKFNDVFVAVCEDRVKGVETIISMAPYVNVIVLDDSYQHRKIKPGFNILLTDYSKPFYKDLLLPAGRLREPISGRERADAIVVTKCPENIDDQAKAQIKGKLKVLPGQAVFFTSIAYQSLVKAQSATNVDNSLALNYLYKYKIVLFTGIANTAPLETFLKNIDATFALLKYPDHHRFSDADIEKVILKWKDIPGHDKILLTTEKDWRRIEGTVQEGLFNGFSLYFLPIGVQWEPVEKPNFDKTLLKYVEGNRRSS